MSNDPKKTEVDLNKLYSLGINSLKIETPKTIRVDFLIKYLEDRINSLAEVDGKVKDMDKTVRAIWLGRITELYDILSWIK